jgi:hypothetical protein
MTNSEGLRMTESEGFRMTESEGFRMTNSEGLATTCGVSLRGAEGDEAISGITPPEAGGNPFPPEPFSPERDCHAEFTLSRVRSFAALRMTESEGLRMTEGERLRMTNSEGLAMTCGVSLRGAEGDEAISVGDKRWSRTFGVLAIINEIE